LSLHEVGVVKAGAALTLDAATGERTRCGRSTSSTWYMEFCASLDSCERWSGDRGGVMLTAEMAVDLGASR